jgi:hypothetical protein
VRLEGLGQLKNVMNQRNFGLEIKPEDRGCNNVLPDQDYRRAQEVVIVWGKGKMTISGDKKNKLG